MEGRTYRQRLSAERSVVAGLGAMANGRLMDAAALFRCAAAYCEGAADGRAGTLAVVTMSDRKVRR